MNWDNIDKIVHRYFNIRDIANFPKFFLDLRDSQLLTKYYITLQEKSLNNCEIIPFL